MLGVSSLAAGATLDGAPAVRANLDGDAFVAAHALAPRRLRRSLDDATNSFVPGAPGSATSSVDGNEALVLPPLPRRVFRVSLDDAQPALAGRLIRLSIDEGRTVYGRLSENTWQGRRLRTTLD